MASVLHGCARTTPRIRAELQASQESTRTLATRYGLNPKTVAKWKKRSSKVDAPMGPREPHSTVLTEVEEAMIVEFRRRTLLPLDDDQVLAIAEQIEPGMRLAFCTRNAEAAQLDLVRIATEVRAELEISAARHLAGAVYVSCSGRGGPHFGARHAELQVVRNALGDLPLVGFFAGGEIARHHLYGYTGVLTAFTTPA